MYTACNAVRETTSQPAVLFAGHTYRSSRSPDNLVRLGRSLGDAM
jgi:hypothetical protein